MGYGEFGGNGSVHWRVDHENNDGVEDPEKDGSKKVRVKGKDPIPSADIGTKYGGPSGHFRLDVIYGSSADAQAALNSMVVQGANLVLYVKANTAAVPANQLAPPQIRVRW